VQVNGRVRGRITIARDASEETARALALADTGAKPHLEGKTVKKFVYVPGRIVNVIVG
jgi:leucyl-tRNA synthetase